MNSSNPSKKLEKVTLPQSTWFKNLTTTSIMLLRPFLKKPPIVKKMENNA